VRQSLPRLRALVGTNCSVRAWMQFGRAPLVGPGEISDLRYEGRGRDNFSEMPVPAEGGAAACPPNLTGWGIPRQELLRPL
jgi:inner membrane protein